MNTSAVHYSSESWSRRCSVESILTIQGVETDFVRDSSDTELSDGVELEPCTDCEEDAPPLGRDSDESDDEIIATKVVEVSVLDDGDLEFADSEQTDTEGVDSEVDLCDYWHCAQCGASNNNPMYRYCESCYKVRKNFFPPRPKRKHKRKTDREDSRPKSLEKERLSPKETLTSSQESGIVEIDRVTPLTNTDDNQEKDSLNFRITNDLRTLSQDSGFDSQEIGSQGTSTSGFSQEIKTVISEVRLSSNNKERPTKRRAGSADRKAKRIKVEISSDSDSNDSDQVSPIVKTVSDPSISVEDVKVTKKIISDTVKEIDQDNNMCIVCLSEPKSGVFVHGRIAHICCCYKCAVKVWAKAKRCPVCNCKVSNVLRAVVM
ncbi:zinc finger, c3HC4 type (RING finger) domain-containing protein [Phthorimaea operculella]|nr:zinc finger, c3HC4 type (RING finger) domain-containing protein [Phthorimaea operculella]